MLYRILLPTCISSYALACDHPKKPIDISQDNRVQMDTITTICTEVENLLTDVYKNTMLDEERKRKFIQTLTLLKIAPTNTSTQPTTLTKETVPYIKSTAEELWKKIKKDITDALQ